MSKELSPLKVGLLFVALWSFITLIFDGIILFGGYRQMVAESYPLTTGSITHSEVTVHHGDDSTTFGVDVKYTFEVAGKKYEGNQYRYGQWSSSDNSARRIVDSLPVGTEVDVHYNPSDPSDAVLAVGIQSSDLFMMLFLMPFNMVMLGGWCVMAAFKFPAVAERFTGKPRVVQRNFTRRLILEPAPRLASAAFVMGLSSFISIFIVAIPFGFSPPMVVIKTVWGIVLGLGAASLMRRPKFPIRGKKLVLDDVENTLSIGENAKNQTAKVLDLACLIDVVADEQGNVALIYSDETMAECRDEVIQVIDPHRAEELAAWTKEQVFRSARQ